MEAVDLTRLFLLQKESMNSLLRLPLSLLLGSLLFTSGCSSMWSSSDASSEQDAAALDEAASSGDGAEGATGKAVPEKSPERASRIAKAVQESGTSTVEVLWQVPGEAVEKYHLYYGLEADELSNHIEVSVSELQKVDDPKHGPVYRYELKDIPAQRAIYLSLRAENKYGMSDPSPAAKIAPGQKTVTP